MFYKTRVKCDTVKASPAFQLAQQSGGLSCLPDSIKSSKLMGTYRGFKFVCLSHQLILDTYDLQACLGPQIDTHHQFQFLHDQQAVSFVEDHRPEDNKTSPVMNDFIEC